MNNKGALSKHEGFCSISGDEFDPSNLEDLYVHQVYNAIATDFSSTRHSPWPSVMQFLSAQPPDAFGVDVGCGNGKYLVARAARISTFNLCSDDATGGTVESHDNHSVTTLPMVGLERSIQLAEIVSSRGHSVVIGDILQLPYCSERFDFLICIAVIHHLSTMNRRIQAVKELARILRPGGCGIIQVWAKEQHDPNSNEPTHYVSRKLKTRVETAGSDGSENLNPIVEVVPGVYLPVHISGTEFPTSDMLVPWKDKQTKQHVRERYYHLFVQGELDQLLQTVPSLFIEKSYYEQGNWVIHVVKSSSA